jgi:2,4-dienoyl-CoA reductase-like NADH-dependent reductase (Old Yellow Enzyme family)
MRTGKHFDHNGSAFDSFLEQEGILAETEAIALKRVIAWQIERAMAAKGITKNAMAKRLGTSRTQIKRLLDPSHVGVSIETIARAAKAVGKRVTIQIVEAGTAGRRSEMAASDMRLAPGKSAKPAKVQRKDIARAG